MSSVLPKNIDVSALRFSEPKRLSNGSNTVYVTHKGERLFIQTPLMHLPYGVNNSAELEAKKNPGKPLTGPVRYDICLSFRDLERNPKVKELYDLLDGFQTAVIDAAFANRVAWFRNDFKGNRDFVVDKFQHIIRLDRDPETNEVLNRYPPIVKGKLPYDAVTDTFQFECYNTEKQPLDFASVKDRLKGGKAQALLQVTGLWFAGGRFGVSLKVIKIKFELPGGLSVDFEEDSDGPDVDALEDAEQERASRLARKRGASSSSAPPPLLPASEDEEDEEEGGAAEGDEDAAGGDGMDEESDPTPPPPPPMASKAKKGRK